MTRSGDEAEFREWLVAHQRPLLRFAELVTGDRGRGEDLLQDALVRTFASWSRLRDGDPAAYTRRCILNGRTDWWRRRRSREVSADLSSYEVTGSGRDEMAAAADRITLLRALQRLTARERAVVAMRHYLGLTERETAHELRMAIGTVKSSNARALDKLRRDPTLSKEDEHDGITR